MIFYFILLFILFIVSIFHFNKKSIFFKIIFFLLILFLALFIGLRDNVGGDYVTYSNFFTEYLEEDLSFNFTTEPFFYLFYKFIGYIGLNLYAANLISAILLLTSLSLIIIKEKYPLNGLFLSFPVLLVIVGMGFNRQSIALSMIMFGLLFWDRSFIKYSIFVIIASLFHKSAIIMILFNRLNLKFSNIYSFIILIFVSLLIYLFISPAILLNTLKGYPLFEIKSYFSYLRVVYILLPSLILLTFKKSFFIYKDYLFLNKYSIFSLILLPAMVLNVTIANRLSFYFLPLSIIILSRLPMIFSTLKIRNSLIVIIHLITLCYFTFFIFYANNINGWIPYNNLLIK